MKCKIEWRPNRHYSGEDAYELMYERSYDAGGGLQQTYWDSAGFFFDEDSAMKAAFVIKEKTKTLTFEV